MTIEHPMFLPSSRRGFLTLAAAASAVSAGSLAVAAIPPAAPDESRLLELEEKIFALHEAETANDHEIVRLFNVWDPELRRLQADLEVGRSTMTSDEIWACVGRMPEAQEHTRLVLLKHSIFCKRYELMQQMEAIPARTPEGRRAKLLVLLNFWVNDEWRVADPDAPGDIPTVRRLLIEFVGGEPGNQLRDQFA